MTGTDDYVSFDRGGVIFREGEPGHCAYFIERGQVEIGVERVRGRVVLARCGPGELFGEMAIIDDQPRSATATATEPCQLLVISREQLARRLEQTDPVLRMCLGVILRRFRTTLTSLQRLEQAQNASADRCAEPGRAAEECHLSAVREIRLEQELRHALGREDFELHYQPIIDLRSGLTAGFEALIRWRHPQRGLISPVLFIPTAEASGLIVPIGRWVFSRALGTLARLNAIVPERRVANGRLFMSVNVSGRDFADPEFMLHVDAALAESGIDPSQVKLEITESLLMSEPDLAVTVLDACRSRGLGIAIDDFGTGYSSLNYLHRFPIDTLKIDRSFVRSMSGCDASRKIVAAIIGLARQLDLPIVAEGIEEPGEAARLRHLGCEYGQGFLFAEPLPEAAAFAFLTTRQTSAGAEPQPLPATA